MSTHSLNQQLTRFQAESVALSNTNFVISKSRSPRPSANSFEQSVDCSVSAICWHISKRSVELIRVRSMSLLQLPVNSDRLESLSWLWTAMSRVVQWLLRPIGGVWAPTAGS